jgi:hypothetical protein
MSLQPSQAWHLVLPPFELAGTSPDARNDARNDALERGNHQTLPTCRNTRGRPASQRP